MCKVLMTAGLKPKNVPAMQMFMQTMGQIMSFGNRDGLGYTAMTKDGALFGNRWLDNTYAFTAKVLPNPDDVRVFKRLPGLVEEKELSVQEIVPEMNSYGNPDWENVTAVMLHTRFATSAKGMQNTHPFVTPDNKMALIHNGVISNHRDFKLKLSTCDSECILVSYMNRDLMSNPENIQITVDELEGYYAAGVMCSETKTLDIFKYNASLHFSFIKELGTFVFTTSGKDIEEACKHLKFTHERIFEFKSQQFLRIDAITGNMIKLLKFKERSARRSWENREKGGASPKSLIGMSGKVDMGITIKGTLRKYSSQEFQEEVISLVGGA